MVKRIIAIVTSLVVVISCICAFFFRSDYHEYKNLSYGDEKRQKLDLYIPKENDGEVGLVLYIHGGGWVYGDKKTYDKDIEKLTEKSKYAAATMNYRYLDASTDINDILDDIDLALKCIKEKALKKDVIINKVLLTGHSAGGHLSMLYGFSRVDTAPIKPAAVVSYCGPTYFLDTDFYVDSDLGDTPFITDLMSYACGKKFTFDTIDSAKEELLKISPLTYVNENTVPTVINQGVLDTVVPYGQALMLQEKFEEYGVEYVLNSYPNSNHNLKDDADNIQKAQQLFEQFCDNYLN